MPYRVLKEVSLRTGQNRDVVMHNVGEVLSDSQVDAYVIWSTGNGCLRRGLTTWDLRPRRSSPG